MQTRMGVREAIEPFARRVVRDHLPEQHRDFYRQLPFVVLAAWDGHARSWATLVAALRGVATSFDPYTLDFATNLAPLLAMCVADWRRTDLPMIMSIASPLDNDSDIPPRAA